MFATDIHKLQILNDLIGQTLEAIERRSALWGTTASYAAYAHPYLTGVGPQPYHPMMQVGVPSTPWALGQGYGMSNPFQVPYFSPYNASPFYGWYGQAQADAYRVQVPGQVPSTLHPAMTNSVRPGTNIPMGASW